jgi:hypothetical protein
MDEYQKTIAQIDETIAHSGDRIRGLANNLNRALNLLSSARAKGMSAVERDVLLSFEALCVESLWRTAWLLHERRDHDGARHCIEVGRTLQQAVEHAAHG